MIPEIESRAATHRAARTELRRRQLEAQAELRWLAHELRGTGRPLRAIATDLGVALRAVQKALAARKPARPPEPPRSPSGASDAAEQATNRAAARQQVERDFAQHPDLRDALAVVKDQAKTRRMGEARRHDRLGAGQLAFLRETSPGGAQLAESVFARARRIQLLDGTGPDRRLRQRLGRESTEALDVFRHGVRPTTRERVALITGCLAACGAGLLPDDYPDRIMEQLAQQGLSGTQVAAHVEELRAEVAAAEIEAVALARAQEDGFTGIADVGLTRVMRELQRPRAAYGQAQPVELDELGRKLKPLSLAEEAELMRPILDSRGIRFTSKKAREDSARKGRAAVLQRLGFGAADTSGDCGQKDGRMTSKRGTRKLVACSASRQSGRSFEQRSGAMASPASRQRSA